MDVTYEPAALRDLRALPKADRARILDAFAQLGVEHPKRFPFTAEMQGRPGLWRLRKGDYRAIYRITDAAIEVVAVGHGREIYR